MFLKKRAAYHILAFSSLAFGMMSVLFILDGTKNASLYRYASFFIILSAAIHRYDSKIAKLLNFQDLPYSEITMLSGLVSFCIAPSMLIYNINNHFSALGIMGHFLGIIFPIAGAYSLSRKNGKSLNYGFSTTLAGVFLTIYSIIILFNQSNLTYALSIIIIFMLSFLMISSSNIKKML